MDLECRQETVNCWEAVGRRKVEREESGEMIVPDACPDVGEVLVVRPRLLLQRREAGEGRGEFAGLIKTTILYRPEGESGEAAMEVTLPFSATVEEPAITSGCILWTEPWVLTADVHLLNSRKVLVKAIYRLDVTAYCPRTESFLSLAEDPAPWGIRQQEGTVQAFLPVSIQEKAFTYQDTLTLPAGQPDPEEVLSLEARCLCTEARVVGDKLLFKGEAVLDLLCRDGAGVCFPVRFQLPYSQVMEGEADGDICQVSILLSDISCVQDTEDPRSFRIDLSMTAQGAVRRTLEIPVLSDLYSTIYELEAEREAVFVQTLTDRGEAQESTRILLPWPGEQPEGASCQDIQVRLVRPTLRREGEDLNLDQEVAVSALCVGETETFGLEKTETISHRLPAGEGEFCLWSAELTRDPSTQAMPEGLEVAVPLTFRWLRLEEGTCPVIRRVTLGEKRQVGEDTPSLIIRAVRGEQTLWDIAKANGAAQEDIMAASGLTDPELYSGQMLLIPRSAR